MVVVEEEGGAASTIAEGEAPGAAVRSEGAGVGAGAEEGPAAALGGGCTGGGTESSTAGGGGGNVRKGVPVIAPLTLALLFPLTGPVVAVSGRGLPLLLLLLTLSLSRMPTSLSLAT